MSKPSTRSCRPASRAARSTANPPPELGAHTDEILTTWLGYTPDRIASARQSGAI